MTNSHVRLNPKQKLTFFHSDLILSDAPWEAGDVQLPPGVFGVHTSKISYSIIYKEPTFAFTNKQTINLFSPQPLLNRRKRLTKVDVQPVEGWR